MKQFAVCHVSKGKGKSAGLTKHNERERTPKNADPAMSQMNRIEDFKHKGVTLEERAKNVIQQSEVSRKVQKDAVLYCPIILSGSHERMIQLREHDSLDDWMKDNRKFIADKYGEENIISFAMHADELTPHIHVSIVPIIKENKKGKESTRLSARDMFNPGELKKLQTEYAEAMRKWGFERGMDSKETRAKHQEVKEVYRDMPNEILKNNVKLHDITIKAAQLQQEANKVKPILEAYKEHKNVYDKFSKAFFDNAKIRPLIEEIGQLKSRVISLQNELKGKEETIGKQAQQIDWLTTDVRNFKHDSKFFQEEKEKLERKVASLVSRHNDDLKEQANVTRDKTLAGLNKFNEANGIDTRYFWNEKEGKTLVSTSEQYKRYLQQLEQEKNPHRLNVPSADQIRNQGRGHDNGPSL